MGLIHVPYSMIQEKQYLRAHFGAFRHSNIYPIHTQQPFSFNLTTSIKAKYYLAKEQHQNFKYSPATKGDSNSINLWNLPQKLKTWTKCSYYIILVINNFVRKPGLRQWPHGQKAGAFYKGKTKLSCQMCQLTGCTLLLLMLRDWALSRTGTLLGKVILRNKCGLSIIGKLHNPEIICKHWTHKFRLKYLSDKCSFTFAS